jgi:drug/metabolite transporter (DMT)-like permease
MKNIQSAAANRRFGMALIIISAASFGVMPIFARLAYNAGAEPITVLFLRFAIAAVVMNLIMVLRRTAYPRGLILLELILLGAIAYVGESLAYFLALKMASAGLVALLLYIYPALVTALSAIFLKEHLTRVKIVALFLALSGTALTLRISGGGSLMGILLGIAAAVDYAIYILLGSRIVHRSGPMGSTTVIITSTAGVYAGIVAIHGVTYPATSTGWIAIIAIALISTVLAFVTFFAGLKRIGPTSTSTLSTFEPIVAVVLAAIVLGETISPIQILGGILILAAVVLLATSDKWRGKLRRDQGKGNEQDAETSKVAMQALSSDPEGILKEQQHAVRVRSEAEAWSKGGESCEDECKAETGSKGAVNSEGGSKAGTGSKGGASPAPTKFEDAFWTLDILEATPCGSLRRI